jgi:hypothetical protein
VCNWHKLVKLCSILLAIIFSSNLAKASNCRLIGKDLPYIPVWTSEATMNAGLALLRRGESDPNLIVPLMACLPMTGDIAAIEKQSVVGIFVSIKSGAFLGCKGIISDNMCDRR